MKKIIRISYIAIVSAASTLLFGACDFLNIERIGKSDIPTHYTEPSTINLSMLGVYSLLTDYYKAEFIRYPEVAGDMMYMSPLVTDNMRFQYNFLSKPDSEQETAAVGYIWKSVLKALSDINMLLYYIPDVEKNYPNEKEYLEFIRAEGLFARALVIFDLNRCYAQPYNYTADASHLGVPALTHVPAAAEPVLRNTSKQTYARITDDLNEAIGIFSSIKTDYRQSTLNDRSRFASLTACEALLARVYLYMDNFPKAEEYASKVIAKVPLTPFDKYQSIFDGNTSLGANDESVFKLSGNQAGHSLYSFYNAAGNPKFYAADTLVNMMDNGDVRKGMITNFSYRSTMKYYTADPNNDNIYYDIQVMRASEMYLIRAEAICQQGVRLDEAAADVKAIVARAHGIGVDQVKLTYSDRDQLLDLVEIERIKELCFEGHRFFDIVRRKHNLVREAATNSTVHRMDYPNDRFVLPIPFIERQSNPAIQQNPGYTD